MDDRSNLSIFSQLLANRHCPFVMVLIFEFISFRENNLKVLVRGERICNYINLYEHVYLILKIPHNDSLRRFWTIIHSYSLIICKLIEEEETIQYLFKKISYLDGMIAFICIFNILKINFLETMLHVDKKIDSAKTLRFLKICLYHFQPFFFNTYINCGPTYKYFMNSLVFCGNTDKNKRKYLINSQKFSNLYKFITQSIFSLTITWWIDNICFSFVNFMVNQIFCFTL